MESHQKMTEKMLSKVTNMDNPLARELVAARHKMQERLLIEGYKPYYKVRTYTPRII